MNRFNIFIKTNDAIIDLKSFNATFMGYQFNPAAPITNSTYTTKSFNLLFEEENLEYQPDTGFIEFIIRGKNHLETDYLVRKFLGNFIRFDFRLNVQKYWREFIVDGDPTVKWLNYDNTVKVTLNGKSFCWGDVKERIINEDFQEIYIDSPNYTPLSFRIFAVDTISGLKINEITINSLLKNKELIINGRTFEITIDGKNASDQVSLYEIPIVKGIVPITLSNHKNAKVFVRWQDRL